MKFKMRKVSGDRRGVLYELGDVSGTHLIVQTINSGKARGGHSHTYPEEFFVVKGGVLFISKKPSGAVSEIRYCKAGDKIVTSPKDPHMVVALEDSVLLEGRPTKARYKSTNDPVLREIVNLLAEA